MARPRNNPDDPKWAEQDATEREIAPETPVVVETPVAVVPPPVFTPPAYVPPAPRQMRVERQGAQSEPYTRRFPQVRGGVCEYCGILDKNVPSQFQYKLCPHYRGQQLMCSYCPESKNPDDVIYHSNLNVAEHPDNPGVIIAWCDSYECSRAHEKRFKRNN